MNQLPLPTSGASGWTPLARGDQENDAIQRCPSGHIHLDYGNFSVRFYRHEFLAFAKMVAEAAAHLSGQRTVPMLPITFSSN
jgi:hypothetical protein